MAHPPKRRTFHAGVQRTNASLDDDDDVPARKSGLFAWTVVILLLIGFAIACWIFSFYVFGHPEQALSYNILTKLKKLDPPKRFEITAAPRGEFLTAEKLWDRYNKMTDRELARTSEKLLRNYVRNYKLTQDLVPYVIGPFTVLDSFELTDKNLFIAGAVVVARSDDAPHVLLEQIFPNEAKFVSGMQRALLSGREYNILRSNELSALLNVKRLEDGRLFFTAVPILYGAYAPTDIPGSFSLEPPETLNVAAGLPVVDAATVGEAEQKLAANKLRNTLPGSTPAPKRAAGQLVRVQRPKAVHPEAIPAATPTPVPVAPVAEATPQPEPPTAGVPPDPAAGTSPAPSGDGWTTYAPGRMPRGRLVEVSTVGDLAGQGRLNGSYYLQGDFVVSASGNNIAVLRVNPSIAARLGLGTTSANLRIIVTFPSGRKPPAVGTTIARDSLRPFAVQEVRKSTDNEVNVYAREITQPE